MARGIQGVLFYKNGAPKSPFKGPKQLCMLPLSIVYCVYYTLYTGLPRKLAGKPFLQSSEPDDPFDYDGHGLTAGIIR